MEAAIQVLIYIHAAFGSIALLTGLVAVIARKGKTIHKKFGLVFYYTMILSGTSAMLIAVLPNHENPFLFAVGIFSLYFVLTGYRALRFKRKASDLKIDKAIALVMLFTGVLMIVLPVVLLGSINIVLGVFGIVGIIFSIKDLRLFKEPKRLRSLWLKLHLGKMLGGYIAASTAFVVVNQFIPGVYAWFAPGIIGSVIIVYWNKKINKKPMANSKFKA